MANTHIRFNDINNYELTDSEDEYEPKERNFLQKIRTKSDENLDSEEEVYGLDVKDSSSDSENEIADSDVEEADNDDLPDVRAWGKSRRDFYQTDYVDQDFGGFQGKDATEAEFEESEARGIQKRLAEQLDDEDFSLDVFNQKLDQNAADNIEIIKSDVSSLSKRELHRLLQKESPEMFMLIDDCKVKMTRVKQFLYPVIQKVRTEQMGNCEAVNFVKVLYNMTLNYCVNVYMYLLLKASKINIQIHPILKRLYQYRQLIAQLEPIYEEIIRPQLEILVISETEIETEERTNDIKNETEKKVKKLKLLQKLDKPGTKKASKSSFDIQQPSVKKSKIDKFDSENENDMFDLEKSDIKQNEEENTDNLETENFKRPITYQMQKNKGLTPYRKKEQRNPRVKHRNRFKKANIRRKGAVREVRKELSRYAGEISGIKASVSKSIKIK